MRRGVLSPDLAPCKGYVSSQLVDIVRELMDPDAAKRPTARQLLARRELQSEGERRLQIEKNRVRQLCSALGTMQSQHQQLQQLQQRAGGGVGVGGVGGGGVGGGGGGGGGCVPGNANAANMFQRGGVTRLARASTWDATASSTWKK